MRDTYSDRLARSAILLMRVAHVGSYKPDNANGVNKTLAGLVKYLPLRGIETEVWHVTSRASEVSVEEIDGVPIFHLPAFASRVLNLRSLPKATRDFVRNRSEVVDLVHLHSVFAPENIQIARLCAPRRYALTPNGGYSEAVLSGRNRLLKAIWIQAWEKGLWANAAVLHAVSSPERIRLQQIAPGCTARFIPNGIGADLANRVVPDPSTAGYWLYLGRLDVEHKGLDLLLEGYAAAKNQLSSSLPPLLLAGPDSRGADKLRRLSVVLKIADQTQFVGPVYGSEKIALIAGSRLFIHTSRWEGMPFAVLEAMALGRPTLLTQETNLADFVLRHDAGFATTGLVHEIASSMARIADMPPAVLDTTGQRAREAVLQRLTWPAIAEEMEDLYRTALT